MGKIPGIHHLNAVRAPQKAGFAVVRQGKRMVLIRDRASLDRLDLD
jgi:hypothetical protein